MLVEMKMTHSNDNTMMMVISIHCTLTVLDSNAMETVYECISGSIDDGMPFFSTRRAWISSSCNFYVKHNHNKQQPMPSKLCQLKRLRLLYVFFQKLCISIYSFICLCSSYKISIFGSPIL